MTCTGGDVTFIVVVLALGIVAGLLGTVAGAFAVYLGAGRIRRLRADSED